MQCKERKSKACICLFSGEDKIFSVSFRLSSLPGHFLLGASRTLLLTVTPFSSTVVTLYLFQLFAHQNKSYSALVMAHTALKWFHSFVPLSGPNPLDDAYAKNVIESAKKREDNPTLKKEPISPELIKKIIIKLASEGASLKDLRIAALCTLVSQVSSALLSLAICYVST